MKKKSTPQLLSLAHPRTHHHFKGHQQAEKQMLDCFYRNKIPHAWLIAGPKGIGKATFAYAAAKFLCTHSVTSNERTHKLITDPAHPVARRITQGSFADVLTLEGDRGDITVEKIREIAQFLHLTPAESNQRIVIIDSTDALNINAANALLKLLEEPPVGCLFFLISHSVGEVLPTIRSRCRLLSFAPLEKADALQLVHQHCPAITEEKATQLLLLSEGAPGTAIIFHHHNILAYYQELLEVLNTLPSLDMQSASRFAEQHSAKGAGLSPENFIYLLNRFLISLVKKAAGLSIEAVLPEEALLISRLAVQSTLDKWLGLWEKTSSFLDDTIRANLDPKQVALVAFDTLQGGVTGAR